MKFCSIRYSVIKMSNFAHKTAISNVQNAVYSGDIQCGPKSKPLPNYKKMC